jgi:thymidine kinase
MTVDGITTLLPYFEKNHRTNHYLSNKISDLTLEEIYKDEIILDESYLAKLNNKNEIEKFITTIFIDDAQFFNSKLKDDIFGNSLKEVIKKNQKNG